MYLAYGVARGRGLTGRIEPFSGPGRVKSQITKIKLQTNNKFYLTGKRREIIMKILVGYEESRVAEEALKVALHHARTFKADIFIVTGKN